MSLPDFFFDRITADVRQQMDGILALADRLGRQRLAADDQACVASVAEAAAGVRRLMEISLDLNAIAEDGPELSLEPLRLRELMDDVQDRWHGRAALAAVTLLVSYDGDPEAAVVADRARLLQIFDGLIGEAIGGQSRGAVEASLRASPTPSGVKLEGGVRGVRDAAWDAQDLQTRIRSIEARLGLEVALGALLARRLIERMDGALRSETSPGASGRLAFELILPQADEAPEQAAPAAARPAHVLVVDDNATNRMVAQSLVEMFDCTSEAAQDGVEAVEAARSGRFDLILMDIRMPNLDGVAATRAIRAMPGPVGSTPIIALTANADPADAAGYVEAGMNGVVEKPMKPEQLFAALQQALSEGDAAAA